MIIVYTNKDESGDVNDYDDDDDMENNHPVDLFSMSLVTAAMAGSCQDGIGRAGKYTPHDGDEDDGDDDDGDDDDDDNGDCSNIFVPLTGSWFYFGESVDFLSMHCFELEVASNLRSGMKLCFQNSLFLIEGFGKHDSIHSNSFMTTKTPSSDMIVRTNAYKDGIAWCHMVLHGIARHLPRTGSCKALLRIS